ncbi:MAG: bifunctional precorrin-2 dehydrogenase/sirohydrochlorin ferrochelatase [Elusimicrobiota bacterium]
MDKTLYFPMGLNIKNRFCLVIGNDFEAFEKAERLASFGAKVTIVAEVIPEEKLSHLKQKGIQFFLRAFDPSDLDGKFLVFLCLSHVELTEKIVRLCSEKNILLCAIDQPEYCDIVNQSIFQKGFLTISVATNGVAPTVAKKIREGLELSLCEEPIEEFLEDLKLLRDELLNSISDPKERRKKLIAAAENVVFKAQIQLPTWWLEKKKDKK